MASKKSVPRIEPKKTRPFLESWRLASAKGRIATLPELAAARTTAPRPHTPGKPWETYLDGKSPLWQSWLMTSSCLLVGSDGHDTVVTVVHGLEPETVAAQDSTWFAFSEETWMCVLSRPLAHFSPAEFAELATSRHEDGWFRPDDALANLLFVAMFGDSLAPYIEEHTAIAAEFMFHVVGHRGRLQPGNEQQRQVIANPPIISIEHGMARLPQPPEEGALGCYLCLEPLMNFYTQEFRPQGQTRLSEISLAKPRDDTKFLVL